MYNMLLVDDDEITRSGLSSVPFWSELGIRIAGTASDGEEALDFLKRFPVDVLLTDVKMPRMDGLQLAEAARSLYPELSIVFVSGYDDVPFIRRALKVDAVDYILKPVDLSELKQCFQHVANELSRRQRRQDELSRLLKVYNAASPFWEQNLIDIVMTSQTISEHQLMAVSSALDEQIAHKNYFVAAFRIGRGEMAALAGFEKEARLFARSREAGRYAVLFNAEDAPDAAARRRLVLRFRDHLRENGVKRVILSYTDSVGGIWALRALCERAEAALADSFCCPNGAVLDGSERPKKAVTEPQRLSGEDLTALMYAGDRGKVEDAIQGLFSALAAMRPSGPMEVIPYLTPILQPLDALLRTAFTIEPDDPLTIGSQLDDLGGAFCLEDMRETVSGACLSLLEMLRMRQSGETKLRVNRVRRFIQAHFAEQLTLEEIARQVSLSPTYLCMLFREETGETINGYMTAVRIEQARRLLADVNLKLYDVSQAVGYPNPSYFTRIFRKYTGMSPTEYRNHCIKGK